MSSYRYMRLILFFDLPTVTASDRKEATAFRKNLIKDGFLMLQESVYCKLSLNGTGATLTKNRVTKYLPDKGSVMMLTVTEKQFENMDICFGKHSNVEDSDSKLVIL
jgi:CRISPR-associated endoribonuclease cas2